MSVTTSSDRRMGYRDESSNLTTLCRRCHGERTLEATKIEGRFFGEYPFSGERSPLSGDLLPHPLAHLEVGFDRGDHFADGLENCLQKRNDVGASPSEPRDHRIGWRREGGLASSLPGLDRLLPESCSRVLRRLSSLPRTIRCLVQRWCPETLPTPRMDLTFVGFFATVALSTRCLSVFERTRRSRSASGVQSRFVPL